MTKKINIEFTEAQFRALCSVVSSCSAVLDECPETTKEIKLIDRALAKKGYKRSYI